MTKTIRDRNIWRVYLTILVLGAAYGLAVAVIALHLDALGFREQSIGGLAAWFASGIVLLSIPAGRLVRFFRREAHAHAGRSSATRPRSPIFPLLTSYGAIAAARFVQTAPAQPASG